MRFTSAFSGRMVALHQQTPTPAKYAFSRSPVEYSKIVTIIASTRFSFNCFKSFAPKVNSFAFSTTACINITSPALIQPCTHGENLVLGQFGQ
ncbi:MAG: hypothetical protein [Circular genetic element sp.]|nr:MAG: hypothetical protein [Circular genetic element sp.]